MIDANSRIAGSLLKELEDGQGTSQRALAWRCGIALGRTNLILRALIHEGLIVTSRARPRYVLTAQGQARSAQLERERLRETVAMYGGARARIEQRLGRLLAAWPAGCARRLAFVGSGFVAEIAFACLQGSDVELAAVFDSREDGCEFFGFPVQPLSAMATAAHEHPILITFLDVPADLTAALASMPLNPERLMWL
jgi:hypothetical protein